jgi:hypothetical protein
MTTRDSGTSDDPQRRDGASDRDLFTAFEAYVRAIEEGDRLRARQYQRDLVRRGIRVVALSALWNGGNRR